MSKVDEYKKEAKEHQDLLSKINECTIKTSENYPNYLFISYNDSNMQSQRFSQILAEVINEYKDFIFHAVIKKSDCILQKKKISATEEAEEFLNEVKEGTGRKD